TGANRQRILPVPSAVVFSYYESAILVLGKRVSGRYASGPGTEGQSPGRGRHSTAFRLPSSRTGQSSRGGAACPALGSLNRRSGAATTSCGHSARGGQICVSGFYWHSAARLSVDRLPHGQFA